MKARVLILVLLCAFCSNSFAQWSSNPAQNLAVCDASGEQALPLIASTSSGGCFISWFDNRNGNYDVYLQLLNRQGVKQWAAQGLLVSNNPQNSSLVGYDLSIDRDDNALLAFTDVRNGDLKVFAYKISPQGAFLWGANGIALSTTSDYQVNPKIIQTSDGNYLVAWILAAAPYKIALQKITQNGTLAWPAPKLLASSLNRHFSYPDLVASDNGSAILVYTEAAGNFPAQAIRLRAQKIDAQGTSLWGGDGKYIQDIGRIGVVYNPGIVSDGRNGAAIWWQDDRDNNTLHQSFAQFINSNGDLTFPANGIETVVNGSENNFYMVCAYDTSRQCLYAFLNNANPNQSAFGIKAQKITASGGLLWGDGGKVIQPLSAPNTTSLLSNTISVFPGGFNAFYIEATAGGMNGATKGFSLDSDGNHRWQGEFINVSNASQEKMRMVNTMDKYFDTKLVWVDKRTADRDIFAQNVKLSGQLGDTGTAQQACVNVGLIAGWSLVTVGVNAPDMRSGTLFPQGLVYAFSPVNGYQSLNNEPLVPGKGYWVKYPQAAQFNFCGTKITTGKIPLGAGWNIIGGYDADIPVAGLTSSPPNIVTSSFFSFNNGYQQATVLEKGKAYWVRASQAGDIIVPLKK